MDINSMLSSGEPAAANKPSQSSSPVSQRQAPPPLYHQSSTNGHPQPPPLSHHPSQQHTPQYAPPSQDFRSPSSSVAPHGSKGLAPLQTPTQQYGQYPFPQSTSQSPVTGMPGQQYPPFSGHPATTPGGRPPSYGFQQQPATPSQYGPSGMPQGFQQQHPSHSPTPPSHHSHTPHSVRQSPMTTFMPAPQPPHAHQLQYQQSQHSQPSTPLGPPSLQHQRTSGLSNSHPEAYSPYHQRNFSGASNGVAGGSPAQPHHPSIGNMVESPSAYSRQSSQHIRRTSDHLSQMDRERSVSVSPKTKVPPRVPSQGSRQSSLQESSFSTRSSIQQSVAQPYETQSHVPPPTNSNAAQPQYAHPVKVEVPQTPSQISHAGATMPVTAEPQTPLSSENVAQHHHSQKMGMDHLLTPAHDRAQPETIQQDNMAAGVNRQPDPFMPPAPRVPKAAGEPSANLKVEDGPKMSDALTVARTTPSPRADGTFKREQANTKKRPASSELNAAPPMKRERRRYTTRPIWAQLHKNNPLSGGVSQRQGVQRHGAQRQEAQRQGAQQRNTPMVPNPPVNGRANGHAIPPWELNPPLDHDLLHAREVLGPWEKTFKWNTPYPDMLRSLQDWLYVKLAENADVGNDPATGAIEIEAKIGTLIQETTGDRVRLPVTTIGLIHPDANKHYRFESRMEELEHKAMNNFLNTATQESHQPGRVKMRYAHLHETDSFASLSAAGYKALPATAQKRPLKRELRLRTSRDSQSGQVLARIVKIPLGDIHIYNPNEPYDCRISMNLEVNLDRPDLDPTALIEPPTADKPAPPERKKDRLSYKHLCYSVDLTKVEVQGMARAKYELELEMDPKRLREQMALQAQGRPNGVADIVSGFIDNACFLMKQRPTG